MCSSSLPPHVTPLLFYHLILPIPITLTVASINALSPAKKFPSSNAAQTTTVQP